MCKKSRPLARLCHNNLEIKIEILVIDVSGESNTREESSYAVSRDPDAREESSWMRQVAIRMLEKNARKDLLKRVCVKRFGLLRIDGFV